MKVFVNDIEVEIFRGARAKSAVLKYLRQTEQRFRKKTMEIHDEWGNEIAEDSPLHADSKIYFK